jgi:hypothetical protein
MDISAIIHKEIYAILRNLANLNSQQEVWIRAEYYHPLLDFEEMINQLADLGFFDTARENGLNFDPAGHLRFSDFARRLHSYRWSSASIHDPAWLDITREAGEVMRFFTV